MATFFATNRATVKRHLREAGQGAEMDERIDDLIPMVSQRLEGMLRTEVEQRSVEERPRFSTGSRETRLGLWPIKNDSVTLKQSPTRNFSFDSADVVTLNTADYYVDHEAGIVHWDTPIHASARPGMLQAEYRGGMACTFADLVTLQPALVQAATRWVADLARRAVLPADSTVKLRAGARADASLLTSNVPSYVFEILGALVSA